MGADVVRSPSDVLRAVVAAVVLAVVLFLQWLFDDTLLTFAHDALRGIDAVPHWIVEAVVVGTRALAVVLIIGGFITAVVHGRWRMLLTVGLASAIAAVLFAAFDAVGEATPAPV